MLIYWCIHLSVYWFIGLLVYALIDLNERWASTQRRRNPNAARRIHLAVHSETHESINDF